MHIEDCKDWFERALRVVGKSAGVAAEKAEYLPELCSVHADLASVWERLEMEGRGVRTADAKPMRLRWRISEPSVH